MPFDREKTTLQETGTLVLPVGYTLRDLAEIVGDLGIDPATVRCSSVCLLIAASSVPNDTP